MPEKETNSHYTFPLLQPLISYLFIHLFIQEYRLILKTSLTRRTSSHSFLFLFLWSFSDSLLFQTIMKIFLCWDLFRDAVGSSATLPETLPCLGILVDLALSWTSDASWTECRDAASSFTRNLMEKGSWQRRKLSINALIFQRESGCGLSEPTDQMPKKELWKHFVRFDYVHPSYITSQRVINQIKSHFKSG